MDVPSALADPAPEDCVFCGIVAGRLPAQRLAEDERTVAFLDQTQATRGHALVVPRVHTRDLLTADPADVAACAVAAQALAARLVERLGATGVTVLTACGASAGQTVAHLHLHVLPRTAGDRLRMPWTPRVVGEAERAATAALLA